MNGGTALLDAREMGEADRLTVCAGRSVSALMENASRGVAQAVVQSVGEIIPLALTAILASIPVALPATFTLTSALGARALAKLGVLPTRLSAVDEAASVDVLCADKTGRSRRPYSRCLFRASGR